QALSAINSSYNRIAGQGVEGATGAGLVKAAIPPGVSMGVKRRILIGQSLYSVRRPALCHQHILE
ncbi:MAG TPA: hypothetical protein VK714_10885, partial [Myxococcota bacterium]|nr:hypothetical protein [Myxococcota bacterium]